MNFETKPPLMKVLLAALKFYSILLVLALGIFFLQGHLDTSLFFQFQKTGFLINLLWGLGTGLLLISLSLHASQNFQWASQLNLEFRKVLVPLTTWQIGAIAIASGTAEEIFFRGAIQPLLGLLPTSLLFGLMHLIPRRTFLPWAIYAAFAGFLFGCLLELRQNLFPSILSHVLVNFVMILVLNHTRPRKLH